MIIETDSREALNLLGQDECFNNLNSDLVKKIKGIGNRCMNLVWKKIKRESNMVADTLAKKSRVIRDTFVIFEDIPDFLVFFLSDDTGWYAGPSNMN